jgi:omega-6 fatty acid desaturase (delta-12 desaturase)
MNERPNLCSPPPPLPVDHKVVLARYREPNLGQSVQQLLSSVIPFCILWSLMWFSLRYSYWITLMLSVPTAGLLVRLFILQHDCGHGSFFKSKRLNDMFGFALGVLVLTPYHCWCRQHALHHATSGDLDRRGFGDVAIMTVREYLQLTSLKRLGYRLYRNPFVLFGIAPVVYFVVLRRFTYDLPRSWKRERASVHCTNLALLVCLFSICWLVGLRQFLLVHVPVTTLASSLGVWLFYVQHNFEATYWQRHDSWDFGIAGMAGSSYYHLPKGLQWLTANIGFHHIHHLDSRIPNYRLQECFDGNSVFQRVNQFTLRQSLSCVTLKLWDENEGKMVGFQNLGGSGSAP